MGKMNAPFSVALLPESNTSGDSSDRVCGPVPARRVLCVCLKAPDCGNKLNIAIDRSRVRSRDPPPMSVTSRACAKAGMAGAGVTLPRVGHGGQ